MVHSLTTRQREIIAAVLKYNHDYYRMSAAYRMPYPCMFPDEILSEIESYLRHDLMPDPYPVHGDTSVTCDSSRTGPRC